MIEKIFTLLNRGMKRDLSVSKAGESSAFENHNIRILARGNDTLLSVTNERGNKLVDGINISGTVIGWNVLNNNIIVFSTTYREDEPSHRINPDKIYRIVYDGSSFDSHLLFDGNLGFRRSNPIESIVYFESENIQKIYWVDGLHVLRFMNFAAEKDDRGFYPWQTGTFIYDSTYFDSNRKAGLNLSVEISKDNSGTARPNGVVQYLVTYFNKHGQETANVWFSDIVYLSPTGIGGSTDGKNNNVVTLKIKNLDTSFSNFRVYSIFRSTNNGTPVAYLVAEQKTSGDSNGVIVIDDFAHNTVVDAQSLLFLGSKAAVANTLAAKDETLFLGGLKSIGRKSVSAIEEAIRNYMFGRMEDGELVPAEFDEGETWEALHVSFAYSNDEGTGTLALDEAKDIAYSDDSGNYSFRSQLEFTSSNVLSFKGGEKYRFALRFKFDDGTETDSFWIGDKENKLYPIIDINGKVIKRIVAKCVLPKDLLDDIANADPNSKISAVQLMIAEAGDADRAVKAQGIANPTMFNVWERFNDRLYSVPSWISRPRNSAFSFNHFEPVDNSTRSSGEIQSNYWKGNDSKKRPYFQYDYKIAQKFVEEFDGELPFTFIMTTYMVQSTFGLIPPLFFIVENICTFQAHIILAKINNATESILDEIKHLSFTRASILNWPEYDSSSDRYGWRYYNRTDEHGNILYTLEYKYVATTARVLYNHGQARSSAYEDIRSRFEEFGLANYFVDFELFWKWCEKSLDLGAIRYFNTMCYGNERFPSVDGESNLDNAFNLHEVGQSPDEPPSEYRWAANGDFFENLNSLSGPAYFKKHLMFVDENVVTLDSPEISYGRSSFDNAELKFRIVGLAKMTSVINDYIVSAENSKVAGDNLDTVNISGKKPPRKVIDGIISWPLWKEAGMDLKQESSGIEPEKRTPSDYLLNTVRVVRYWLHMWQKTGSIIGYTNEDGVSYSSLKSKTFANLRFSYSTIYLNDTVKENNITPYTPDFIRVPIELNDSYKTLTIGSGENKESRYYDSRPEIYLGMPGSHKYPISFSSYAIDNADSPLTADGAYLYSNEGVIVRFSTQSHAVIGLHTNQKYVSREHRYYWQEILPRFFVTEKQYIDSINNLRDDENKISGALIPWCNDLVISPMHGYKYRDYHASYKFVDSTATEIRNDARADTLLTEDENDNINYMLVGEVYKDYSELPISEDKRYGGITLAAVEACRFISAGPSYSLPVTAPEAGVTLIGNQGDTYIQRYDALRVKPYSNDSENNVIDITSVMLETHINLDGRTDNQRGIAEIASIDTTKFGALNDVYSQLNSFSVGRDLDEDFNADSYPTAITWTLPKSNLAEVDEWSHITLASSLSLDGDKGACNAIRRFGNGLIAFQDRAISEILFNSRTQLATQEGVPIEIANSGKVDGKRYISNKYGCTNKWSIVEGKSALYFVDNINKAFCAFNGNIENLSTSAGFGAWFRKNNTVKPWTPENFDNIVSFYDRIHSDVYLVKKDDTEQPCLVYNESLQAFTSFFDYGSVDMMANIDDRFVSLKGRSLWLQNEGLYGNFFGTQYPFWVQYRVAPDFVSDKIWTNVEYRADFYRVLDENGDSELGYFEDITDIDEMDYQDKETFDSIRVWNEYQDTGNFTKVPDKKFRTWSHQIPRAASNDNNIMSLDRIRNPWINLKLMKMQDATESRDLMQLHDVEVKYFE